jgi:LysM repeat protein
VDVNLLDSISESETEDEKQLKNKLAKLAGATEQPNQRIQVEMTRAKVDETHYVIQAGDNLWAIAQRYGTTVAALAQLNNIPDPELIHPGNILLIRRQRFIRPAQLAYLSPKIPQLLVLEEVKE